ncbi:MAG: hypothetical protein OHK0012_04950 [Synechococcales cyanobacterium]
MQQVNTQIADQLLRLPEVKRLTGLSRSRIYRLIAGGQFPSPCKVGRSSLWKLSEINEFVRDPGGYTQTKKQDPGIRRDPK